MPKGESPEARFPTRARDYAAAPRKRGILPERGKPPQLEAGKVYRSICGRDPEPVLLTPEQVNGTLHDPFARLVLGRNKAPITLLDLLSQLDEANGQKDGLPAQSSFVVADGGMIPWTDQTKDLNRQFRFVVVRGPQNGPPLLMVSTSTAVRSSTTFLQVVGWDPQRGAYQFYDRHYGAWIWAGSSWDALEPDTRGQEMSPFDSHMNGALNMKELKQPWINWNSQAAAIPNESLAPDDPLRGEPLWKNKLGAEKLEIEVIRPGIARWSASRFAARTENGKLTRLPEFLRQVLDTTTINLTSSPEESSALKAQGNDVTIHLPLTFFINADALIDRLKLAPDISRPTVSGEIYKACLQKYDVALTDQTQAFKFPGDTHFVFLVPEPAFEDLDILGGLLEKGLLTPRLAACLLMVDFCNPVFSARRAALLAHVPDAASIGPAGDFADRFVASVKAAAAELGVGANDAPEGQFLSDWSLPETAWRGVFESRIKAFFGALAPSLTSVGGFDPIFRLAESRRREFRTRKLRKLAEFRLTTPITNIPEDAPLLEFTSGAQVVEKQP